MRADILRGRPDERNAKETTMSTTTTKKTKRKRAKPPRTPRARTEQEQALRDMEGGLGIIRDALIDHMNRAGYTRYRLAAVSGVPRNIVYEYLGKKGDRRGVSLRYAEALMRALKLRIVGEAGD